jgi:hypothetical protein
LNPLGQTKHTARTRFKEHHNHIRLNHTDSSNVAKHVLDHINDRQSTHSIHLDDVKLLKEVRKQNQLDAYESIFIKKRKNINNILMNGNDGNIKLNHLLDLII